MVDLDLEISITENIIKALQAQVDRVISQNTSGRFDDIVIRPQLNQLLVENAKLTALKEALSKAVTIPEQVIETITEQIPTTIDTLFTEQIPTTIDMVSPQTEDNILRNALLIGGALLLIV